MTRGDRWLGALLAAALLLSCVTDHDALQKMPSAGSGAGGALASAGSPAQTGGTSGAAENGGGHADDEAPGKSVFTIVNGVVDAPSIVLCWAKVDDAGGATPFGSPLGGAPLEYGRSLVVLAVKGADVATDTLQPFAIAGDLDLITGLDCEAAVARAQDEELAAVDASNGAAAGAAGEEGGAAGSGSVEARARLRVRGLPAVSAGTLSAGFSILYVPIGCLGGATFTGKNATEYCGADYTERAFSATAALVSLSRKTQPSLIGMQVVHASLATPAVDVSSNPPLSTGKGLVIASDVVEGQAAPRPALFDAASAYGVAKNYVQVSAPGVDTASYDWAAGLQSGGLTGLANGSTYALVLLGPRADHTRPTALWNASSLTVIAVDPPAQ